MKLIKILLLSLLSISGFAQKYDLIINLDSLKGVTNFSNTQYTRSKNNTYVSISDHTFDFKTYYHPTSYRILITGNGTRGLVLKNMRNIDIYWPAILKNSSTSTCVKIQNSQYWSIDGLGVGQIWGNGNSANQVIYVEGNGNKNYKIKGLYINQGRTTAGGSTVGGAAVQYSGCFTSACNGTNFVNDYTIYEDLIIENANDEPIYHGHYTSLAGSGTNGFLPNRTAKVIIKNVRTNRSGRDGLQVIGVDSVWIINNIIKNVGYELESNHISGISYNGGTKWGLIEGNTFENVPQFMFIGSEDVDAKVIIRNNKYIQGTHPGSYNNQAIYIRQDKKPLSVYLENNDIQGPNVLKRLIAIEKATVTHRRNNFVVKAGLPIYAMTSSIGGSFTYLPKIKLIEVPDFNDYDSVKVVIPTKTIVIK